MGYTDDESMVRVDFFTCHVATKTGQRGHKWKYTESVMWTGGWKAERGLIHDQFAKTLRDHLRKDNEHWRMSGLVAFCLEPYHEHRHSISLDVDVAREMTKKEGEPI